MSKRIHVSCVVVIEDDADIDDVMHQIETDIDCCDDVIRCVEFNYCEE